VTHNDDLTGIFDNATVLDFTKTKSSAFSELFYPDAQYPNGQVGVEAFNAFVAEQLRATGYAFHASDGQINPIGVLGNETMRRAFSPDDDEILGQYLQRLGREARAMQATWFFISQITPTGWFAEQESQPEATSAEAVAAAGGASAMTNNIYWYAERREDDQEHRHGIIEILPSNRLGRAMEAISQSMTIYGQVLSGSIQTL
jgi:hypothetical protein